MTEKLKLLKEKNAVNPNFERPLHALRRVNMKSLIFYILVEEKKSDLNHIFDYATVLVN